MGRGVNAGGGQSPLGYIFCGGDAPKPAGNSAEAPPKQVPDASGGPSQESTATASPQPLDVTKHIPAGIRGSQANNYFRAGGQNCGNFIMDWPSTKVHEAPGAGSSLGCLFVGGSNRGHSPY